MKYGAWGFLVGIASSMAIGMNIAPASAVTLTLYDGSTNVTPDNFTPKYLNFVPIGTNITQTASGGVTTLNTNTDEVNYAGYSNYNAGGTLVNSAFPMLDNNAGYTLSFRIKLNSQTNQGTFGVSGGTNRAGFSATVLGSNHKGIEIGFRNPNTLTGTTDIFSQDGASFTIGEQNTSIGNLLNTLNTYDLTILGNSYTLKNGSNTLLTGLLRDYTAAAVSGGLLSAYALTNFVSLGDNTGSAGASVDIASITLTTVPEPSQWLGIGIAIGAAVKLKRKLGKLNNCNF